MLEPLRRETFSPRPVTAGGVATGALPFAPDEIEESIIARWRRVMARFADQVAVTTAEGAHYTYAELDQAANHLAHALLDALGPENCPVVLLLDHSYPLLVSILGTLKAGKAYVAFDSTQAVGQLQLLNQTTAAPVIVTDREHHALAQALVDATPTSTPMPQQIWRLDAVPKTTLGTPDLPLTPDTLAGIFFTSGTISQPKGIARTHRIVLHRAWFGAGRAPFTPADAISGIRQCGLGGGMADVFNALLYGATYALYHLQRDGLQGLSPWLQRERISYFHPPIVLFRQWLETLAPGEFYPHLRFILPSGRKTRADLERLWPHVPASCMVLTSYSATETTQITSTAITRTTPLDDGVIPVGAPLPGKHVTVMNDQGQPVGLGEVGEIVVRSRYIATGYWRQPELTAQRFTPTDDGSGETIYRTGDFGRLRADGYLELVGRQDSQVKLRGYRVVLTEVEDALRALPNVREAAVTADEERGQLWAYLIAATALPTPPAAIRTALATRFPHYALPTQISYLPAFPLLPSGKIDRKALPVLGQDHAVSADSYQAPRSELEQQLVTIYETLLQTRPIGVHDNFFERGGHSLLAMRLITEIQQRFGQVIPMLAFAQTPTIAQLALSLSQAHQLHGAEQHAPPDQAAMAADQLAVRVRGMVGAVQLSGWRRLKSNTLRTLAPYALRARLLAWYCRQPQLQRKHYPAEVQLIEAFYAALDHPSLTREAMVQQSLMAKLWLKWGVLRLHHTNQPAQLERWFTVRGLAHLQRAMAQHQGVILARSHTLFSHETFFVLERNGFDNVISIGLGRAERTLKGKVDDGYLMAIRSHLLFQTRQILQQGGIISISPDGLHGNRDGFTFAFHGRQRTFRHGFAELALDTGAPVVPVFVSSDPTGRFQIDFAPPLAVEPNAAREAQLAALVTQYVNLLRINWATHPASVQWPEMQRHLALPAIQPSMGSTP